MLWIEPCYVLQLVTIKRILELRWKLGRIYFFRLFDNNKGNFCLFTDIYRRQQKGGQHVLNKKYLFTVAAIPAAFVVPAVAGAEEVTTLTITGNPLVGVTLNADLKGAPAGTYIKSYQWYYVEGGSNKPIPSATEATFKLPVEAEGKTVLVEAVTTTDTKYTSNPIVVPELSLKIEKPSFEGYGPQNNVLPGDTVKVIGAKVTDTKGAVIQSNQITYSYEWFYKTGDVFTIISGVNTESYTIPKDALETNKKDISVRVIAKVGTKRVESDFTEVLTVSKQPIETLVTSITNLRKSDSKYQVTDFASFEANVKALETKYQALSATAKASITNYDVLKRALADVEAISKLNKQLDNIPAGQKDLAKYISELEASYDKLDLLQRSLDVNDTLYSGIKALVKEPSDTADLAEVRRINNEVVALLNYDSALIKYAPNSVEALQLAVNKIEADIAKLSKNYQVAVQNQTILKDAKQDLKKIEQFIKLFDKLTANTTANKQVTIAKSIRSSYEKLTYKQLLLVPNDYKVKLLNAENAEQDMINRLNAEIKAYIGDKQYQIKPTADSWQGYVNNINKIVSDYKSLTKNSAAKIIDYDRILILQKDFKAAEKVIKDIDGYKKLANTAGVTESKLKTSYSNTLKAYNKLTTLQQSLVYNAQEFLNSSPNITVGNNGNEPTDKADAEALKVKIQAFANVTSYTFTQFEAEVEEATKQYKKLSSPARKYVTNYDLLTTATKDLTGVRAFHKKVQAAREELDVAKQTKKIESVDAAYAKLPANQQHLAKAQYEDLLKNRLVDTTAPDISKLIQDIAAIETDDLYKVSIQDIQNLANQYNKLSSSDKKRVTNASILTAAIADVKKVESFMKQYDKSFVSNPTTVIKAFAKLTSKQMSLVSENVRQQIIAKEKELQQANDIALTLIEDINSLVQNGDYIANLEAKVTQIRTAYDKLTASEKSVVKNYSKLTQAENDLKKVAEVHALYVSDTNGNEAARKAWQTAYGKLSKKLENLYKNMYAGDL